VYNQYKTQGYGHLYLRKLKCNNIDNHTLQSRIKVAYARVQDRPYDTNIFDWILGYYELNKDIQDNTSLSTKYQKTNEFWCSALVSYILVECGLLDKNVAWTLISPIDYANYNEQNEEVYEKRRLPLINGTTLQKIQKLC